MFFPICINFAPPKRQKMKITKNRYLAIFIIIVLVLAVVRCVNPGIAGDRRLADGADSLENRLDADSLQMLAGNGAAEREMAAEDIGKPSRFFDGNGNLVKNKIFSVPHFGNTFPDSNNVQLESAKRYGVKPVLNRTDAAHRMKELVYVGASPFYTVDRLKSSIPYLVPRAAILLNDIGRNFFDSLQIKQVPLHRFILTSVLRTHEDIDKLRMRNGNATLNSCHLYGTTFDICYNRYTTVSDPDGAPRRAVRFSSARRFHSPPPSTVVLKSRFAIMIARHYCPLTIVVVARGIIQLPGGLISGQPTPRRFALVLPGSINGHLAHLTRQ